MPKSNYTFETHNKNLHKHYSQHQPQQSHQLPQFQQLNVNPSRTNSQRLSQNSHPGRVVVTEITNDVWKYENDWAYDLCNCCEDTQECLFSFFCAPCYWCELFDRTDEHLCTPCFTPLALMAMRSKLRTGFRIKGSICSDCLITSFCPCCSAMQMKHELIKQGL